ARAAEDRRAALAARHPPTAVEQAVNLGKPGVDADDRRRPLGEQVVAKAAAPVHLDEEAAQVRDAIGARLEQCAPRAAKEACMGPARLQAVRGDAVGSATPSEERCHPAECTEALGVASRPPVTALGDLTGTSPQAADTKQRPCEDAPVSPRNGLRFW